MNTDPSGAEFRNDKWLIFYQIDMHKGWRITSVSWRSEWSTWMAKRNLEPRELRYESNKAESCGHVKKSELQEYRSTIETHRGRRRASHTATNNTDD